MRLSEHLRQFDPHRTLPYENRLVTTSCESTNDLGKLLARSGRENLSSSQPWLLVALEQTKGRGRWGSGWQSPVGGIYVSIALPAFSTKSILSLPLLTGLGICRGLDAMISSSCRLKWPNDVLVCGRKIAGVLIETVGRSNETCHAVIGFGVNFDLAPEDTRHETTCIVLESTDPPSLPAATRTIVSAVTDELSRSDDLSYAVDSLERLSVHEIGEQMICRTSDGSVSGRFIGFDSRGFLRLRSDEGELIVSSAEMVSPGWETER